MISTKNNINGWLIIDKPKGITSSGVVGRLKFLLRPQKIGHAGTLDPLATGVLPIAFGKATRLIPFVMDDIKTYEFDIEWGTETDTDDLGGAKIATSDKRPTKKEILNILPQFRGQIFQTPSPYSAIKINGERAYNLARKGKKVKIPARSITVYQLELLNNKKNTTSFMAKVSKGTYIRTLAHDIAHALKTVGVVVRLRRIKDGPFEINQAISLEDNPTDKILPLEDVLKNLPQLNVSEQIAKRIIHGQRIKKRDLDVISLKNSLYIVWHNNQAIATALYKEGILHPQCTLYTK